MTSKNEMCWDKMFPAGTIAQPSSKNDKRDFRWSSLARLSQTYICAVYRGVFWRQETMRIASMAAPSWGMKM
jgi:hypothetical protein